MGMWNPAEKKFYVTLPSNWLTDFENVHSQPEGWKVPSATPNLQITAWKHCWKKNVWSKIFGAKMPLLNLELLTEIYLKVAGGFICSFVHEEVCELLPWMSDFS